MILILGSEGQLGKDFVRYFKRKNIDFLDVDKKELDITNFRNTKASIEYVHTKRPIDFIINCAAFNDLEAAEEDVENCFKLNCDAVVNLAEIAANIKAGLLTFSTDYVFNGSLADFFGDKKDGFREEDEPSPQSVYAKSKFAMEEKLKTFMPEKKIYIVRTSWLFGGITESSFVYKLMQWSKKDSVLNIVDDEISSPSYTRDLVKICHKLIEADLPSDIYHITNDGFASRYELAKYFLIKSNWKGKLNPAKAKDFNSKVMRPQYSKLNCDKIKKLLNIEIQNWRAIFK